jgi:ribosome maturation factor RimP
MAIQLDEIRAAAERVAASHDLDVVDVEFSGGTKFRALRVFIEKNAEARARLAAQANAQQTVAAAENSEPFMMSILLPQGVPVEMLSGVTHEDCERFARDFGTLLDVEDVIPGAEYTLEVSSPGLERKLSKPNDFVRFLGSLVKLQTFTAVGQTRHFQGRLTQFENGTLTLDLAALKQKGKARKAMASQVVEIAFDNVEKANLIAEI